MRTFSKKQKLAAAVLGAGVIAVAGGGIAYAYWSSSATGAGSAATGTATNALTFTDTTDTTALVPGGTAANISGTVQNTGSQNEYVNSVTVSIDSVEETAANQLAGGYVCSSADYTLGTTTMNVTTDLSPGDTHSFSGATIAFKDLPTTNQDTCQGAIVHLKYSSN